MKSILAAFGFAIMLFFSCSENPPKKEKNTQSHLIYATIWFQKSPEMKACFYQGFNLARERVLEYQKTKTTRPKAVIVDVDETMLDNSPLEAQQIIDDIGFSPELWKAWTDLARAKALPGAKEFSNFCDSLGVVVFYVSNRKVNEINSTLRNLDSLGFSYANPEYLLFKEETSSKKVRREKISEKYEIILLVGDNLNDFSEVFENRGDDWGAILVDAYRNDFGRRFIVLPNPMYGEWEKLIGLKKEMSKFQRDSVISSVLTKFK